MRMRWVFLIALAALSLFIWGSDSITLQGERTVYTVECLDGKWSDHHCTGNLIAGSRYRYRALRAHSEVFFWIAGSSEPSGKMSGCVVHDGRNWECPATTADAQKSVTLAMAHGKPIRNAAWPTRPLHPVSKWTWLLLDAGLRVTQSEDGE